MGRVTSKISPNGAVETTDYDELGRVIARTDPAGGTTEFEYDELGRTILTRDPAERLTKAEYDLAGNLTAFVDPLSRRTTFTYDAFGRLSRTDYPDGTHEDLAYGEPGSLDAGLPVSQRDRLGNATSLAHGLGGRLSSVVDALEHEWQISYDRKGNRTSILDPRGNTTEWAYDFHGRRMSKTLPLGQSESFEYDAEGNLKKHTTYNGDVIECDYDVMGRVTERMAPGVGSVVTEYDLAGQATSITDSRGVTEYDRDETGRLVGIHHPTGELVTYDYDEKGNVSRIEHPSQLIRYRHDELNRIIAVGVDGLTTWTYGYNEAGALAEVQSPNGTQTTFEYDAVDRLTTETVMLASSVLDRLVYGYDAVGNRLLVSELDGSATEYEYDEARRLLSAERTGSNPRTEEFEYDEVGNVVVQRVDGVETTNVYDENDRLESSDTEGNESAFDYDSAGNLLTVTVGGSVRSYDWDSLGRLTESLQNGVTIASYGYDGSGNRVSKTAGGIPSAYLLDALNPTGLAQVLEEKTTGSVVAINAWGPQGLLMHREPSGGGVSDYFPVVDALGSLRQTLDEIGAEVGDRDYSAFGVEMGAVGSVPPYGMAGQRLDTETGLYYLRARYYDPAIGRFISADPAEGDARLPIGLNRYLYANANPVLFGDPTGLQTNTEALTVAGIKAKLVDYSIDFAINLGSATIAVASGVGIGAAAASFAVDMTKDVALSTAFPFVGRVIGKPLKHVTKRASQGVNSAWRLGWAGRGGVLQNVLLGRPRLFKGRPVPLLDNIRGVDDVVESASAPGKFIATQIKTLDLRAPYQAGQGFKKEMLDLADKFWDDTAQAIPFPGGGVPPLLPSEISERVLYIGIEPKVISQWQITAMRQAMDDVAKKFGGKLKIIVEEVDVDTVTGQLVH